jgi:FkbM family methyltransferase
VRDFLFGLIAASYPTERISQNKVLAALWRMFFFGLCPRHPFIMRTAHYRLIAHPRKGTLTRAVIRRGHWEPLETNTFISHLKADGFVIDVGANFGHYSLVAAKFVGTKGNVIAFEPHGSTFALLKENCDLCEDAVIHPIQAGIAAQDGCMTLTGDTANPGGHSFVGENVYGLGPDETVPVHRLDTYLANHYAGCRVDVIKIDVQGLEAQVIDGAIETIERDRPTIFLEISPVPMRNAGDDYHKLLEYFKGADYRPSIIDHDKGIVIAVDYAQAALRLADPAIEYLDFLFEYNQST